MLQGSTVWVSFPYRMPRLAIRPRTVLLSTLDRDRAILDRTYHHRTHMLHRFRTLDRRRISILGERRRLPFRTRMGLRLRGTVAESHLHLLRRQQPLTLLGQAVILLTLWIRMWHPLGRGNNQGQLSRLFRAKNTINSKAAHRRLRRCHDCRLVSSRTLSNELRQIRMKRLTRSLI